MTETRLKARGYVETLAAILRARNARLGNSRPPACIDCRDEGILWMPYRLPRYPGRLYWAVVRCHCDTPAKWLSKDGVMTPVRWSPLIPRYLEARHPDGTLASRDQVFNAVERGEYLERLAEAETRREKARQDAQDRPERVRTAGGMD